MKLNNTIIAIILTIGIFSKAHAGVEVGNGGDAVVCRDPQGQILTAELLDYYEARVNFRWAIEESGTRDQIFNLFLNRIAEVNSAKVELYQKRAALFFSEANFLSNIELVDVPDSDHTSFPRGCSVEQLAIQKSDLLPREKRYTINKDIWDHLDMTNQAGLILHEVVYRETLGKHSRYVRYFNGLVASNILKENTPLELYNLFAELGTNAFTRAPNTYVINYQSFDQDGNPLKLEIIANGDVFEGHKMNGEFEINYDPKGKTIVGKNVKSFFEVELPITKEIVQVRGAEFYPSGVLRKITHFSDDYLVSSRILGRKVRCTKEDLTFISQSPFFQSNSPDIYFFPDGDLKSCMVLLKEPKKAESFHHETNHYQADFTTTWETGFYFFVDDAGYIANTLKSTPWSIPGLSVQGNFWIQGAWREMYQVNLDINRSGMIKSGKFKKPTTLSFNSISYELSASDNQQFDSDGIWTWGQLVTRSKFNSEGQSFYFRSRVVCPKNKRYTYSTGVSLIAGTGLLSHGVVDEDANFRLNGKTYALKANDFFELKWDDNKKLKDILIDQFDSTSCEKIKN